MELYEAIIKYGLCSTHIDSLSQMFPNLDTTLLIEEAVEMVETQYNGKINSVLCILCKVDFEHFIKRDKYLYYGAE